jgi:glutathione-regulated potassium-efflux system ancillary protein KefG
MLICHYDNVSVGHFPHRAAMVAQNKTIHKNRNKTGRGMMSQTAKVLLLYAHPESQDSVANRVLLKPAQLSNVTVHDLYAHYPDFLLIFLRAGTAASA